MAPLVENTKIVINDSNVNSCIATITTAHPDNKMVVNNKLVFRIYLYTIAFVIEAIANKENKAYRVIGAFKPIDSNRTHHRENG